MHDGGCRISADALGAVIAHAREALPNECCGLLIGRDAQIERVHRSQNLEASATRFLINPRDHFDALRTARASGREVVGVYHSHPSGTARPSPSDVAEASYHDYIYVIVGLGTANADVRAFRLDRSTFVEQTLSVVSPAED